MTTATAPRTFGEKLKDELDRRGMGSRTLARMLVALYGGKVDARRRAIVRWLRGATPMQRNRELIEDALGLERGSLKNDADAEESAVSLDTFLRQHIHELVARELERAR